MPYYGGSSFSHYIVKISLRFRPPTSRAFHTTRSGRELQLSSYLDIEMHEFRLKFKTNHPHSSESDHPWAATLPLSPSLPPRRSRTPGLKLLCQECVGGPGKDSKPTRSKRDF